MSYRLLVPLLLLSAAFAQDPASRRAIMVREAQIYIAPDVKSSKLGVTHRGREVVVLDRTSGFAKVFAEAGQGKEITGWVVDKGLIFAATPNGDRVIFGEAADSEWEASRRGGRKGADRDALRLYFRVYEYFPESTLAGEALWRAADIRWQLDRADVMSRPSSRASDIQLKGKIEEEWMNLVRKKFPGSKWADMADFAKLENKLCGDWNALPKCPERETGLFEEYVKDHPNSPKNAEALYQAAWRQAALIELYRINAEAGKVAPARGRALALAQRVVSQYPSDGDWALRAQRLIHHIESGIPAYGSSTE